MRILAITAQPDLPEAYLLRGLKEAGVELTCVGEADAKRRELIEEVGIPYHELTLQSKVSFSAMRTLRRLIAEVKPDIVHSFAGRGLSNALLATLGKPVMHVAYRGTMGHLSRWDPTSWITFLNSRVRAIICVSDAVRQYLLSIGIPPSRLRTIYKGHDCAWYTQKQKADLSTLGIPLDAFIVGYTANMRPVKGADVLLEALRYLPATSHIHALLIGEVRDPVITALGAEPSVAPRAHFAGFRADAAALVSACHAIVMPSREREGLPKSVIEGMAQGICPVVSRVGGMPELVKDGECGLIVPPSNATALAQALRQLELDRALCSQLGSAAKKRIETKFNISATIKAHLQVYTELLSTVRKKS